MGHSIKDYLERQSTAELKAMLFNFSYGKLREQYGYAIELIKEILEKREE